MAFYILISLPINPILWRFMLNTVGRRFNYIGYVVSIALIIAFIAYMIRHSERFGVSHYLLLGGLTLLYFYLLKYQCQFPAKRFHFIEYGLLAYFSFRALRFDFPAATSYALAFFLSSAFGVVDESIQYVLPNRVCELRDMMMNAVASALGLAFVAILRSKGAHGALSQEVSK